jgi:hypothetical protein
MSTAEKKNRIPLVIAFLMVAMALVFDGLQAVLGWIPAISFITIYIAFLADVLFLTWFGACKVGFFDRNALLKIGTAISVAIVGFVPLVNMLPELTLGVMVLIAQVWVEDKSPLGGLIGKTRTGAHLKGGVEAGRAQAKATRALAMAQARARMQERLAANRSKGQRSGDEAYEGA